MTAKDLRKLNDKLIHATARKLRAELHLQLATREVEAARDAVNAGVIRLGREQDLYDVRLTSKGARGIEVIKAIRAINNMGLKEAKDIYDFAGWDSDPRGLIIKGVNAFRADEVGKAIEVAGGTVRIEPLNKAAV